MPERKAAHGKKKGRAKKKAPKNPFDISIDEFLDMGTSEVQPYLDALALKMQADDKREDVFERVHAYLHKYIFNQAFNRFIIKGYEGKDIYQEAMIALRFKAIPKFDPSKGMSFLNFAKLCIHCHIVTLLNTSRHRRKDQPMNMSVPLDQAFPPNDDDSAGDGSTLMNVIHDENDFVEDMCSIEDRNKTLQKLKNVLSQFERSVLNRYLEKRSYREIAAMVSTEQGRSYNEKSIDNALLRIRSKAISLRKSDDLPLFTDLDD